MNIKKFKICRKIERGEKHETSFTAYWISETEKCAGGFYCILVLAVCKALFSRFGDTPDLYLYLFHDRDQGQFPKDTHYGKRADQSYFYRPRCGNADSGSLGNSQNALVGRMDIDSNSDCSAAVGHFADIDRSGRSQVRSHVWTGSSDLHSTHCGSCQ